VAVALATDCRRIVEALGDGFCGLDRTVRTIRRGACGMVKKPLRTADRSQPRAKIFCRKIVSGNAPDVVVDVGRIDWHRTPAIVEEAEQMLPGKILAPGHDLRQSPVVQVNAVLQTALPFEFESQLSAPYAGVAVPQRRQSE
jgi:hypothetical protein